MTRPRFLADHDLNDCSADAGAIGFAAHVNGAEESAFVAQELRDLSSNLSCAPFAPSASPS
jgi:hypothetical protein